jgi:hypothetical protein
MVALPGHGVSSAVFMPMDPIPRIREMENLKMWTLESPGMLGLPHRR